jgi:hypothetical protein
MEVWTAYLLAKMYNKVMCNICDHFAALTLKQYYIALWIFSLNTQELFALTIRNLKFLYVIGKIHVIRRKLAVSITKTDRLMKFRKKIAFYSENDAEHTVTL